MVAVCSSVQAQSDPANADAVSAKIEKLQQQLSDQARQIKILEDGLMQKKEASPLSAADDVVRPVRVGAAPEPVAAPTAGTALTPSITGRFFAQ